MAADDGQLRRLRLERPRPIVNVCMTSPQLPFPRSAAIVMSASRSFTGPKDTRVLSRGHREDARHPVVTIGGRPGTIDPFASFVRSITCIDVAGDKSHPRSAHQGNGFHMWNASAPAVVGVDGSEAAIDATIWAIDEAASRDVPLRIVHDHPHRGSAGRGEKNSVKVSSTCNRHRPIPRESKDEPVQLAVVGDAESIHVTQIIRPHARTLTGHGACSLLVVR